MREVYVISVRTQPILVLNNSEGFEIYVSATTMLIDIPVMYPLQLQYFDVCDHDVIYLTSSGSTTSQMHAK